MKKTALIKLSLLVLSLSFFLGHRTRAEYSTKTDSSIQRKEIVFIDSKIKDISKETLMMRGVETIILDTEKDGIEQILNVLSRKEKVDAIHLVTHGDIGNFQLGNVRIDKDNVKKLSKLKLHLNETADILLYACNTAKGKEGKKFVADFSELTGADVAASTDDTGSERLGGNWILEQNIGKVETKSLSFSSLDQLLLQRHDTTGLNYSLDWLTAAWTTGVYNQTFSNVQSSGTNVQISYSNTSLLTSITERNDLTGGEQAVFTMTSGFGASSTTMTMNFTGRTPTKVGFDLFHTNVSPSGTGTAGDKFTITATTNTGTVLSNPIITTAGAASTYTVTGNLVNATSNSATFSNMQLGVNFTAPVGETISSISILWRDADGTGANPHGYGFGKIDFASPLIDHGDAPTSGTAPSGTGTNAYGNASHIIANTIKLGANIDSEATSLASANAGGDDTNGTDDEDGITLPSLTAGATSYSIPAANINVTNTSGTNGTLHAWVDFNKNGTFESSEYASTPVNTGTSGTNPAAGLSWSGITVGAAGNTFARFRLTTDSSVTSATPTGAASNGEVEDYQVAIAAPSTITCPVGSTASGSGYATGGLGQYLTKNAIYWLDWNCGATTQFNPGDVVTKTWTAPNGVSVTATLSNITKTLHPYNTGNWSGDKLDDLYNGVNPIGLRNLIAGEDPSYKVTFSMTLNGVPIPSDIVTAEAEDTGFNNEFATWTTDGDPWEPLEAAPNSSLKATFSNGGKTVYMDDLPQAGGGVLVALTENVSNITVNMNAGGNEAIAFGIMIPFDYGDAPSSYGAAAHYTRRNASGGSKPTTATNVNSLTMATLSYNSPYLGAIGADPETANQPTANADGDKNNGDNDEDAFTTLPNIPTTGAYSLNNIPVNNTTGNVATLHAWVDFNKNGSFEATEYTSATVVNNATTANLSWTVPSGITSGTTYARFRLTTQSLNDNAGTAAVDERSLGLVNNGEVEDYQVAILNPPSTTPTSCSVTTPANPYTNVGVIWKHDSGNYSPAILNSTLVSSAVNETITGLTAAANPTELNINSTSIPATVDTSKYIQYRFTTANAANIELYGVTFGVYEKQLSSHNQKTGTYQAIVEIDDNTSFTSPTLLRAVTVSDLGSGADSVAYYDIGSSYFRYLHYRLEGNSVVGLNPNTTYYVRVYPFNQTVNGLDTPQSYPNIVLWDDFGLAMTNCSPTFQISGAVFEDPNYGGGAGRPFTTSGTSPRPNATVELYDSTGAFKGFTTTNASGVYTFDSSNITGGITTGDYIVRVVNSTVTSSRTGYISGLLPVQTFRTDAGVTAGTVTPLTDKVGGEKPAEVDAPANTGTQTLANLNTGTNEAQSITSVKVESSNINGIDFGFNFDTVVNTNDSGQGSLRQFILNSNALGGEATLAQAGNRLLLNSSSSEALPAGKETSIFMIPPAQLVSGVASIDLSTSGDPSLPKITGNDTFLDGTTQTVNQGNTNSGFFGTGGTVGVDSLSLPTFNRPEVQIVGSSSIAFGIDISSDRNAVRGIAIYGFGGNFNPTTASNIRISGTDSLVENNIVGGSATSFTNQNTLGVGIATQSNSSIVAGNTAPASGFIRGTIRNNLVGFTGGTGITLYFGSTDFTVVENEVRSTNFGNNTNPDGISAFLPGTNHNISRNLVVDAGGVGIDLAGVYNNIINNNTVTQSGRTSNGSTTQNEIAGIRLTGQGNEISRNISYQNYGAGIMLRNDSTNGIKITQNSTYGNGTITSRSGASATNQIGIDLLRNTDNTARGTSPYVTLNDTNDSDAGANNLLNFPVFTSALIDGNNLILSGYARPNNIIELFIADSDPSGFGEGQTYLTTLSESSITAPIDRDSRTGSYNGSVATINGVNPGQDTTNQFRFIIPLTAGKLNGQDITVGTKLTATATDGSNNTSEFSGWIAVADKVKGLSLVKRITKINDATTNSNRTGAPLNLDVYDDGSGTEDDVSNWTGAGGASYLKGKINGGEVFANDTIEYTIYFRNSGNTPISSVKVCDLIPANTSYIASSIKFKFGNNAEVAIGDANNDGDRGEFLPENQSLSGLCRPDRDINQTVSAANNKHGAVWVEVDRNSDPLEPNQYGYIKFKVKVNQTAD